MAQQQAESILIVEDEERYRRLLSMNLELEGYRVTAVSDGHAALEQVFEREPSLVVLDMRMPEMDGFELCKRLRKITSVPILALTALNTESDLIHALDFGADDYMTKPFSLQELMARIRALLRRSQSLLIEEELTCGPFRLLHETREVEAFEQRTRLTPTEWNLLKELVQHAGKVLTHEHLLGKIWGPEYQDQHEYLRVYVRRLRSYLEPNPKRPVYLVTIAGIGYILYASAHDE
ncbi:response regulator transcription factor [Ferroacidibacillus organovorans]|uniref:Two-component system response regulator n=1 Tax=Ferroacidibacillus organovorans TaxID=1765683 RepID=A0A1V4EWB7_9BACL|nr:response regulator transcription factor [Ferroacidibacillus organovorans]OPG17209.1 two-component system response regulator [Ferroacidibacillus organovorans]